MLVDLRPVIHVGSRRMYLCPDVVPHLAGLRLYANLGIFTMSSLCLPYAFVNCSLFLIFLSCSKLPPLCLRKNFFLFTASLPVYSNLKDLLYFYSGRGKFMPLPLKSKILETPGFLVKDYIKMFPLWIQTLNLQDSLMVQCELSRTCNYFSTCPQSKPT
jgi:hypothetical protein